MWYVGITFDQQSPTYSVFSNERTLLTPPSRTNFDTFEAVKNHVSCTVSINIEPSFDNVSETPQMALVYADNSTSNATS